MISSSGGNGWVLPKGGWELDETVVDAARRETVEEAGVRGELEDQQLGVYPYSNRKPDPGQKGCIAHMFVMHVKEELDAWPEAGLRSRRWVRPRCSTCPFVADSTTTVHTAGSCTCIL